MFVKSLGIESLEARRLLSSILLDRVGSLRIIGDNGADNTVSVSLAGEQVQVVLNAAEPQLFDAERVFRLIIRTGNGNDGISITGLTKPTWIFSGEGNDDVTTGNGRDVIHTGGGDDSVNAGDGVNVVVGGTGHDNITTGASKDRIWGRQGNDTINSGDGNDVVVGDIGDDQIDTGSGRDRAYGRDGNDTINGGDGHDTLWGGHGDDHISGGGGRDILGGVLGSNTLLGGEGSDVFVVTSLENNPTNDFDAAEDILRTIDFSDDLVRS